MKKLISCVGDTDPIRYEHDGGILHIARTERPDEIRLIHSEHTYGKHEDIVTAINSIDENYRPTIHLYHEILEDDKVYLFDYMYNKLRQIIQSFMPEEDSGDTTEEVILNLSSGTPQMKSALFTVNQINEFNVKAIQVASPNRGSNTVRRDTIREPINDIISTNKDNIPYFENRCVYDEGKKLYQELVKRNIIILINNYDYVGTKKLIENEKNFSNKKSIIRSLDMMIDATQRQELPKIIKDTNYPDELKRAISMLTYIKMRLKLRDFAEVLIRVKSLSEYIVEHYLKAKYPDLLNNHNNDSHVYLNEDNYPQVYTKLKESCNHPFNSNNDYMNSIYYEKILEVLEPEENEMIKSLKTINQNSGLRNKVAHGLEPLKVNINAKNNSISKSVNAVEYLLKRSSEFNHELLNCYDTFNESLIDFIMD